MTTKRNRLILGLVVITAIILLIFRNQKRSEKIPEQQEAVEKNGPDALTNGSQIGRPEPEPQRAQAGTSNIAPQKYAKALSDSVDSMNVPISFYGRVIDQEDRAIAGAKIKIGVRQWTVSPSQGAEGVFDEYDCATDAQGKFEFLGKTGDNMEIKAIEKAGYELSPRTTRAFMYSGPVWFTSERSNPTVFRMWKRGQAEPLVIQDKFFVTAPDGRSSVVDLLAGKKAVNTKLDEKSIAISIERPQNVSRRDKYDWHAKLQMADGGGLLETTDEFMYLAPKDGYEQSQALEFKNESSNWSSVIKKRYFTKTPAGLYGRVELEIYAYYDGEAAFRVKSFINPSGSRNLEYDEAVQPKPTMHE